MPVLRLVPTPGSACYACAAPTLATARFCSQCGCPITAAQAAERRHVSIAFYDLIGSTSLATALDLEDYTELIRGFHHQVGTVMTRFGGFVGRYLGDGALVYFGYPHASEDDAVQAVRAGLAAIESLRDSPGETGPLHMRVGIAAGMAIVGDVLRAGDPFGVDVAGETPHLAARLQALAEPDAVIVDASVRRMIGDLFEVRDCGARSIRGWSEPVQLWQVLRPVAGGAGVSARRRSEAGLLVGRDGPAARIMKLWRQACEGSGRTVLLTGEAGVGKSRLVEHLLQEMGATQHKRFRYFGAPHQQDVPLYPVIQQIEHSAGFEPSDDAETRRMKLKLTRRGLTLEEIQLVTDLVVSPASGAATQAAPHLVRARTLHALLDPVVLAARRNPFLVVLEDAHWIDPTSAELLDMLVRACSNLRLLVIVTGRPEYRPEWAGRPQVERVAIEPLGPEDSAKIIRWIAGPCFLPSHLVDDILARCDGVPLFLEEVTKAAVEAGAVLEPLHEHRAAESPVPVTLRASLLGRLDRLGETRKLAEIAAVIGRNFGLDMLALVTEQPVAMLEPGLARLTESGLVERIGALGSGEFRFRHALIQDTAYAMMLRARRRRLHGRVADCIEQHLPGLAASQPQLLARHCTEAGFASRAVDWWLRAGTQSLLRSAATEAAAQLDRGLHLAQSLPDCEHTLQRQLDLQVIRARALMLIHGTFSPEVGAAWASARTLCTRMDGPPQLPVILYGQMAHHLMARRLRQAQAHAAELLTMAERRGDPDWIMTACYASGYSAFPAGQFDAVGAHLNRGLALFDPMKRTLYTGPGVGDPAVLMRIYLSWALLLQGALAEARRMAHEALAEAREVGPTWTILQALWHVAYVDMQLSGGLAGFQIAEELEAKAGKQGYGYFESLGRVLVGIHAGMTGRAKEGLGLIRSGMSLHQRSGGMLYEPGLICFEADMLGRTGAFHTGLERLSVAWRMMQDSGTYWNQSEMLRTRGSLRAGLGDGHEAEADLRDAIDTAQAQGARLCELQAATALAAVLVANRRRNEAGRILGPCIARLGGGPEAEALRRAAWASLEGAA